MQLAGYYGHGPEYDNMNDNITRFNNDSTGTYNSVGPFNGTFITTNTGGANVPARVKMTSVSRADVKRMAGPFVAGESSMAVNMNHMDNVFAESGSIVAAKMKAPQRAAGPSMMMEESQVALSTLNSISETVATNSGDFGGGTIPIIGLSVLASIIALLAGPVEDEF